jgi:hypothetical protein
MYVLVLALARRSMETLQNIFASLLLTAIVQVLA